MKFLLPLLFVLVVNLNAQWGPDIKLSTNEVSASTNENMGISLAVSGDSVHAVWIDYSNGSGVYYKHSYDGGSTWSNEARLTPTPSNTQFSSIAVSGRYIYVAYRDTSSEGYFSALRRSTDGGNNWEQAISLGN